MSYYDYDISKCEACGEIVDFDNVVHCEHAHSVCYDCIVELDERNKLLETMADCDDFRFKKDEFGDNVLLSEFCPLCQMKEISDDELIEYCASLMSSDGSMRGLVNDITEKFHGNHKEFRKAIQENIKKKRD